MSESGIHFVCGSVCVRACACVRKIVRLCASVHACICAGGEVVFFVFFESHTGPKLGIEYHLGSSLKERSFFKTLECLAVCPSPF